MTDKPDAIVEEMQRRSTVIITDEMEIHSTEYELCVSRFIPHALKLLAEKNKEIERMKRNCLCAGFLPGTGKDA